MTNVLLNQDLKQHLRVNQKITCFEQKVQGKNCARNCDIRRDVSFLNGVSRVMGRHGGSFL